MVITYWTAASITAILLASALLKDDAASKVSFQAWIFIAIAALIWPVTLPFIVSSKLRAAKSRLKSDALSDIKKLDGKRQTYSVL